MEGEVCLLAEEDEDECTWLTSVFSVLLPKAENLQVNPQQRRAGGSLASWPAKVSLRREVREGARHSKKRSQSCHSQEELSETWAPGTERGH
jgi:hypothetical protein